MLRAGCWLHPHLLEDGWALPNPADRAASGGVMLRDGCWLWALSIAILPQSGCHPFLPWETTSGPACAGHGLEDSS